MSRLSKQAPRQTLLPALLTLLHCIETLIAKHSLKNFGFPNAARQTSMSGALISQALSRPEQLPARDLASTFSTQARSGVAGSQLPALDTRLGGIAPAVTQDDRERLASKDAGHKKGGTRRFLMETSIGNKDADTQHPSRSPGVPVFIMMPLDTVNVPLNSGRSTMHKRLDRCDWLLCACSQKERHSWDSCRLWRCCPHCPSGICQSQSYD